MIGFFISAFVISAPLTTVDKAVTYWTATDGTKLQMDVYAPAEPSKEPRPAVIVLHGGAWMTGKREDMAVLSQRLAEQGMVAATASYRLAPKHKWPAMQDDVQTAVRFLRANAKKFNIRTKKIGAAGASAGGHLSLLLAATDTRDTKGDNPNQSSRVQAVLNLFGPTDFRRDYGANYDFMFNTILAKKRSESQADIIAASPIAHLDKRMAPVFTIHGELDPLVPVAQARWLDESLAKFNIPRVTKIIPGMKHEIDTKNEVVTTALSDGIIWLKDQLK